MSFPRAGAGSFRLSQRGRRGGDNDDGSDGLACPGRSKLRPGAADTERYRAQAVALLRRYAARALVRIQRKSQSLLLSSTPSIAVEDSAAERHMLAMNTVTLAVTLLSSTRQGLFKHILCCRKKRREAAGLASSQMLQPPLSATMSSCYRKQHKRR